MDKKKEFDRLCWYLLDLKNTEKEFLRSLHSKRNNFTIEQQICFLLAYRKTDNELIPADA